MTARRTRCLSRHEAEEKRAKLHAPVQYFGNVDQAVLGECDRPRLAGHKYKAARQNAFRSLGSTVPRGAWWLLNWNRVTGLPFRRRGEPCPDVHWTHKLLLSRSGCRRWTGTTLRR